MNNIIVLLSCVFLCSWILMTLRLWYNKDLFWLWGVRLFIAGLGIQGSVLLYKYISQIKIGYPWFSFAYGSFNQTVFLLIVSGIIFLWIVQKYGPKRVSVFYILFHAGMMYMLSGRIHDTHYMLPLERDFFFHASYVMRLISHAFGIIAGVSGLVWSMYVIENKLPIFKTRHDAASLHYQNLLKLIHWLVGMLFPFFIAGMFFHWVWAYRTQGILWIIGREILIQGLLGALYLLYLNMSGLKNKLQEYRAVLVIIGLILIMVSHESIK
ncbi:MAG: hypothetical protein ABII23_03855 [bacterium]